MIQLQREIGHCQIYQTELLWKENQVDIKPYSFDKTLIVESWTQISLYMGQSSSSKNYKHNIQWDLYINSISQL